MINPKESFIFNNPSSEGGVWEGHWKARKELPYFEGHFPGRPVFPGVGLLDGSLCALRASGHLFSSIEVKKAKFSQIVVPGTLLRVQVVRDGEELYKVTWSQEESGSIFATMEFLCR